LIDLATGEVRETRCGLIIPRRRAVANRLADGRVIVLGGDTGNLTQLLETEIYDPTTDCFLAGAPLRERRGDVEKAVLLPDGRLLVILGLASSAQATPVGGAELLDAGQRSFVVLDRDLGRATQRASVAMLPDGRVLVTGGLEVGADHQARPTDRVVVFDPEGSRFQQLQTRLSAPRQFHAAAALPDGRVLLFGGGTGVGSSLIEEFAPADGQVRLLAISLATPRLVLTAVATSPTEVLVIGGKTRFGADPLATTELVDIGAGWVRDGPLLPMGAGIGHMTFIVGGNEIVVFRPAGDPAAESTAVVITAAIP
jgi:hypothetical protein